MWKFDYLTYSKLCSLGYSNFGVYDFFNVVTHEYPGRKSKVDQSSYDHQQPHKPEKNTLGLKIYLWSVYSIHINNKEKNYVWQRMNLPD